jgi:glucuronide carrier protein
LPIAYPYATYAILVLNYSLVNIPYGSSASAVTQSVHERAKLVAAHAFGAGIGGVVLTFHRRRFHQ